MAMPISTVMTLMHLTELTATSSITSFNVHLFRLLTLLAKVWAVVAQAFYREQTMQFNAIYTRSGYSRPSVEQQQEQKQEQQHQQQHQQQEREQEHQQHHLQKRYLRCSNLSPAPLWIINSLHTHIQTNIMFRFVRSRPYPHSHLQRYFSPSSPASP
jgi:hypothetical protein